MNVICFGDSNTYGYDPRSFFGDRYTADSCWVDILRAESGWELQNEGINGQTIPDTAISVPLDADLLIIMLGTNDLLQGASAESVTMGMERFLNALYPISKKLLLIAPPPMQLGEWVPTAKLIDESELLRQHYRDLAERLGVGFADAGEWSIPMAYDGVHFTEEGHRRFAKGLWQKLSEGCGLLRGEED